jgi:large subunit ribosomal protein L1
MIYSKRISRLYEVITKKDYTFEEAIDLIPKLGTSKFIESVELHVSFNINSKKIKHQINGGIILPHAINKAKRIAIFSDNLNIEINNKNISIINLETLLHKINQNSLDFDVLITNKKDLSKLSSVARVLGSKDLMPSIKNGTITENFDKTILEFSANKINYKADKSGVIHLVFGKVNFSKQKLNDNLSFIINHLKTNKPNNIKGKFLRNIHICTTMSPSIKILNN